MAERFISIDDKALANISGGTQEQLQEIFDYLQEHDPEGYAQIMAARFPDWAMLRYVNDHGVPLVGFSLYGNGDNLYVFGDRETDNIETGTRVSHEEFMAALREKFG